MPPQNRPGSATTRTRTPATWSASCPGRSGACKTPGMAPSPPFFIGTPATGVRRQSRPNSVHSRSGPLDRAGLRHIYVRAAYNNAEATIRYQTDLYQNSGLPENPATILHDSRMIACIFVSSQRVGHLLDHRPGLWLPTRCSCRRRTGWSPRPGRRRWPNRSRPRSNLCNG
jgi:hypothetical protein